jgi:hypothetical protein
MNEKTIVLTLYGTGKVINDFSITLLDNSSNFCGHTTAHDYCSNINELKLRDDNWIYASIVNENQKIKFEKPLNIDFDILSALDDNSIQRVIREVETQE